MSTQPSRRTGSLSAKARRLTDRAQVRQLPPPPEEALDAQLLRWLLHYPLQRIQDMALGLRTTTKTVCRHLEVLVKAGLVEQVSFAYSAHARAGWFYLTTAGIIKTARGEGLHPVDAARSWQADEHS